MIEARLVSSSLHPSIHFRLLVSFPSPCCISVHTIYYLPAVSCTSSTLGPVSTNQRPTSRPPTTATRKQSPFQATESEAQIAITILRYYLRLLLHSTRSCRQLTRRIEPTRFPEIRIQAHLGSVSRQEQPSVCLFTS